MLVQTKDELIRVVDEWIRNFKPSDFIESHNNGKRMVDYCLDKVGAVSITGLTQAYEVLKAAGVLDIIPAAIPKTNDELAAEEIARQHRDFMDSIKPQPSFEDHVNTEKAKRLAAEATKTQDDAKGALALAISGYQCYRVNGSGVDYLATETVQAELSTVVSRNSDGSRDFVRNVVVVRQIIQELPDHPKTGDVARVLEDLNARSRQSNQSKDSFGSDVKRVGHLGGFR